MTMTVMIPLEFVFLRVLTYLVLTLSFSCVSLKSCDTGYLTDTGQIVFANNSFKSVFNHTEQQMGESQDS